MKPSCQALVTRGWVCGVGARYEFEGRHYCKTHHPPTAQARDDARQVVANEKVKMRQKAMVQGQQARANSLADIAPLRAFAHACLSLWPYRGIDDDDLEELAVKYGLLERAIVYRACNAADPGLRCHCADGGGFSAEDIAYGVLCFRKTRRLRDCAPSKEQT